MKTEINKKYGIVALLFTVCCAISLISAVAYLITSADGALYNVLALVWLVYLQYSPMGPAGYLLYTFPA